MAGVRAPRFWERSFWVKDTQYGGVEYRFSTKLLLTILPILFAVLFYKLLTVIGNMANGHEIIRILAISLGVLLLIVILLVVMISIIEYLRTFEESG